MNFTKILQQRFLNFEDGFAERNVVLALFKKQDMRRPTSYDFFSTLRDFWVNANWLTKETLDGGKHFSYTYGVPTDTQREALRCLNRFRNRSTWSE